MSRRAWLVLPGLLLALSASRAQGAGTLFLNRCVGNCLYQAGQNSACNNTSAILSGPRTLSAYAGTDGDWADLLACVRSVLDPFDVAVTDVDPGCANQWEIPVAGTNEQGGFSPSTLGVAPAVCSAIPNNVAFAFANEAEHLFIPMLCNTVVHEFAHLIGVEHETLPKDPMSYVFSCFVKRFSTIESACGTFPGDEEPCFCTGALQSSFTLLHDRLNPAAGLLFGDAFESLAVEGVSGSTCHWDSVLGEEEPSFIADSATVAPFCATDHSVLRRRP